MTKDIEIIPPDRFESLPRLNTLSGPSGNPFSRFMTRQRTKSTAERRELVRELTGLINDTTTLGKSYEDYKRSLVRLGNLETILEIERVNVLRSLETEEWKFLKQLEIDKLKLIKEEMELQLQIDDLKDQKNSQLSKRRDELAISNDIKDLEHQRDLKQRRSDQFHNPPERKPAPDPVEEGIKRAFQGGGKYTETATAMEDELVRKRGGRDKLTEDDKERVRNAMQMAAQADFGNNR
jgi:hypothetical protein